MNRSVFFLWLFAFLCASGLYLFTLDLELGHLNRVIKATPMVLLMAFVWVSSHSMTRRFLMLALSFSLLGDMLLSFDGFFIMGLAAFLLAQLTYTVLFLKFKHSAKYFKAWLAYILLYILCMASIVLPSVMENDAVLAVIIGAYMCAISAMAICAGLQTTPSVYMTAAGAFIFVVSDSLIAMNKFVAPIEYAGIGIMSTYYTAQLLIVFGMVRRQHT